MNNCGVALCATDNNKNLLCKFLAIIINYSLLIINLYKKTAKNAKHF